MRSACEWPDDAAILRDFLAACGESEPSRRAYIQWNGRVVSHGTVTKRWGTWSARYRLPGTTTTTKP